MTAKKTTAVDTEMMVLDTRNVSKAHKFALITDNGTEDGARKVFTIRPMGSDAYMQILDMKTKAQALQKQGKASTEKIQEKYTQDIYDLIAKLVTPQKEFQAIVQKMKAANAGFGYHMLMDNLSNMIMPDIETH